MTINVPSAPDLPICKNSLFTHGTIEIRDIPRTRDLFYKFLGLDWQRQSKFVGGVRSGSTDWFIAGIMLPSGPKVKQSREYRWVIAVAEAEDVDRAHASAVSVGTDFGIDLVEGIQVDGDTRSFVLRDANGCWWEIEYRPGEWKGYDTIFERGDISA